MEKTQKNKQLVRNLIVDVLIGGAPENVDNYISSEQYIQHNAEVPDGLEHFKSLVLAEDKPLDALIQNVIKNLNNK